VLIKIIAEGLRCYDWRYAQRRIIEIRFRFNEARAAKGRPRGAEFRQGHVFDPADFVIRSDGVCRLNPEMARLVVTRVST
jgi:hypothetical protein